MYHIILPNAARDEIGCGKIAFWSSQHWYMDVHAHWILVVFGYSIFHELSQKLSSHGVGLMQSIGVAMKSWCNPGHIVCVSLPHKHSFHEIPNATKIHCVHISFCSQAIVMVDQIACSWGMLPYENGWKLGNMQLSNKSPPSSVPLADSRFHLWDAQLLNWHKHNNCCYLTMKLASRDLYTASNELWI